MWTIEVRDAKGQAVARAELNDGAITIGRGTDRNLILAVASISRKHARIEAKAGKLFLSDEGSANGSYVNGKRVTAPVEINDRSAIQLAEFRVVIEAAAGGLDRTIVAKAPAFAAVPPGSIPTLPELVPAGQWSAETIASTPPAPRPAAAPAPVRPAPKPAAPADDTPHFLPIPSATPPGAAPAQAPPARPSDWAATDVLDKQIESFRSHREQTQQSTSLREAQLNQDWERLAASMRQLQTRLQKEPRVQSFLVSRDGKEISIKITDAREKRGYRYFLATRAHPEGKFPGLEVVWLRELGREDMNYREPQKLLTELMQRIAGTLA